MFWIESCAADLSQWPIRRKGVRSDSNQTAQLLHMAARKSLQMTSGVILNRSPNRSQTKCHLPQERASAQILIDQLSDFRWMRAKAWKRCLAWFWIDSNHSLHQSWLQMKCDVWKLCKWPAMTGPASIFDLKIFWAICLCRQSSTVSLTNHP